jgi:phosphotransferase system IIB component
MKKNFDIVPREEVIITAGPKQNIQEYLGCITRLQSTLNMIPRSSIKSAEKASVQMVPRLLGTVNVVSTC